MSLGQFTRSEFIEQLNRWGAEGVPFLFIVDFEFEKPVAFQLSELKSLEILYSINGASNSTDSISSGDPRLTKNPIPFEEYQKKFDRVARGLAYGDSFLTNLTIKTSITSGYSLRELFFQARAKYKLYYKNEFLVFSPESFVQIENGLIRTFPMKGTIEASRPKAREILMNDPKEVAEHVTIVDLMRNDLSQVAEHVNVTRFRYIDELKTSENNLLQVSSEIQGRLPVDYHQSIGTLLAALLPAGSVSGAPKWKTLQLIREAEQEKRGYFTGVFGYFDGARLDSGVMIRFLERGGNALFYRSGGGITTQSDAAAEYSEAIQKIYVPVD